MLKGFAVSLIGLLVLPVSAFAAGPELSASINTDFCGMVALNARVVSSGGSFEVKFDGVVIETGIMGAGTFNWTKTKEGAGTHSFGFKVITEGGNDEWTINNFIVDPCKSEGGGSIPPCLLDGTCPCIGFTYWELEKGYCAADHINLPAAYVEKQQLIRIAGLLEQIVGLYQKLVLLRR